MDINNKFVIIGGGACGPKAAARARRVDPNAQITMIQDEIFISYAACGLPYYVAGDIKERRSLLVRDAAAFKKISNVDVLQATRADSIDRAAHKVHLTDLNSGRTFSLSYTRLVIATGADPFVPPIQGIDLKGVHILKRIPDAEQIIDTLTHSNGKKAVIIGAGLIGIEMAEALMARDFEVTMVEAQEKVLPALVDEEISDLIGKHLTAKGINLKMGQRIAAFEGANGTVSHAITDKESIQAEAVIFAIGVRPNSKLAKEAGLDIGTFGDISVNEYLQTSDPDIYAGGDCVANTNLISGKKIFVANGSVANKHGHVIGTNIAGGREKFQGIVSSACAKVIEFNVARTGLGEKQARESGFDVITVLVPGPDKPGYYPGSKEIIIKLIVDSNTRRILGGQGTGTGEVIKRIDVLATAITMGMTVDILANLDLCYAPPYNGALDVLHHAANLVRSKLEGRTEGLKPDEVKKKIDNAADFVLLDVRSPLEWKNARIAAPQTQLLPQPELYSQMTRLPSDKELIAMCQRGVRAYQAACALKGAGFKNVKFMEGSLSCWCHDVIGESIA
jgi:NADPH-dependent 2,4-dienoyl-CoA reductase/sulfur reductase-like enzyme/rhodanese-related sulfurtransferase